MQTEPYRLGIEPYRLQIEPFHARSNSTKCDCATDVVARSRVGNVAFTFRRSNDREVYRRIALDVAFNITHFYGFLYHCFIFKCFKNYTANACIIACRFYFYKLHILLMAITF